MPNLVSDVLCKQQKVKEMCLLISGQYISFDSSHIWETGIQTYIAGLQHLPISQRHTHSSSIASIDSPAFGTTATESNDSLREYTAEPIQLVPGTEPHDVAPPAEMQSPDTRHTRAQLNTQASSQPGSLLGSDQPEGAARQQDGIGRNVYVSLAPHNGSAIDSFLREVADPSEWEVYLWQATTFTEYSSSSQSFKSFMKQWQDEVSQLVVFPQAAGICISSLLHAVTCVHIQTHHVYIHTWRLLDTVVAALTTDA